MVEAAGVDLDGTETGGYAEARRKKSIHPEVTSASNPRLERTD